MIQVLQIVKELVTPSRQKAAPVKKGRDIIRTNNRCTCTQGLFTNTDLKSSYMNGVLSFTVNAIALLIYYSIGKGSGNEWHVNMPHFYCF